MASAGVYDSHRSQRRFMRKAMSAPLLTREHELHLAVRWREFGDEDALHELVQAYMRLVIASASRFRNYGLPLADLVQEGAVGLMQAASRFEPERDVRFSTYASWWVRSAMQDHILRNWSIVRTGTTAAQKSLFFNLRRLRAKIDDGSRPHLEDWQRAVIAAELKVSVGDVEMMEQRLTGNDQSLNAAVSLEGEEEWLNFVPDDRPTPEEAISDIRDTQTRSKWLHNSLAELSDREQMIIRERRLRDDGRTLEELGRRLGISKERVRQIEQRALEKLRLSLTERTRDPGDALALRNGLS